MLDHIILTVGNIERSLALYDDQVNEFYRGAISAGARHNISPRARGEYYAGYYAADVLDPDFR